MEPTPQPDLESLRRDWLAGVPSGQFGRRFDAWRRNCEQAAAGACGACGANTNYPAAGGGASFYRAADGSPILVLRLKDPCEFAAAFFASVWSGLPVALGNPDWAPPEVGVFEALVRGPAPERGAILIPTGGTSGGLKLATHNWASLSAAARGLQRFLGGGPIDSCCCLPLHHVSGLMQLIRAVVSGGCVRFDLETTNRSCLSLVPTQLSRMLGLAEERARLSAARVVFVGGAPMAPKLADAARAARLPLMPVYGMTETAAMVAAVPIEDFLKHPTRGALPIGGARVSLGENGRIRIDAPSLFKGYHGRACGELSNGGFTTSDLGRIDSDGRLHVLGRSDALIISGGEKIDPREVEAALREVAAIRSVVVYGEPHDDWGQQVVARISTAQPRPEVAALRSALRARIAAYKIPKRFELEAGATS